MGNRQSRAERGRGTVVFVPLAMNQARFYVGVGHALREMGYEVAVVSFHEGSVEYVREAGLPAINVYERVGPTADVSPSRVAAVARRYGIENVNRTLSHEKAAYETTDTARLHRKLVEYLQAMESALVELRGASTQPMWLVQELGGFLSVAAGFYAARHLGIDSLFMEPSFFRGRIFFVRNSFGAARIEPVRAPAVGEEVRRYLEETKAARRIVIPSKDAGHYRSATAKILNRRNFRRLLEKSLEKHVQGKREEFSDIGGHVRRHLRMAVNGRRLAGMYRDVPPERPFVYYPLHVPADVALTVRSPEYLDQYALIDYLARNVPPTHTLAVKEHPALVGAVSPRRVRELLRAHDNLVLLPPSLNNHDVMLRADAVVTVNSKSGAEAVMLNRPVLALGDSFYRGSRLVSTVESLAEVPAALRELVRQPRLPEEEIGRFFQAVWDCSYPGEIFDESPENCRRVAESLHAALPRGSGSTAAEPSIAAQALGER